MAVVVTEIFVAGHESVDVASFRIELKCEGFPLCVDRFSSHGSELPDLIFVEVRYLEDRFVYQPRTGASGDGTQDKEGQEYVDEVFHTVC